MSSGKPLEPASPDDYGLPPADLTTEDEETALALADSVRDELRAAGFTDAQIDDWARTYFSELGAGDADDLLGWLRAMQDV